MRGSFLLCCFLLSVAVNASSQDAGVRVWVVSDGVRVSPVTGRLIENRPDIHADYPSGDPRAGNLVWDPGSKTVSLKAARNEFTAFQLIIEVDRPQEEFDVKCSGLTHGQGSRIEGRNLAIFKEWYTQVRRASTGYERTSLGPEWYPDALMPYRRAHLNSGFPFSIPDLYNNIPSQRNHAIWIDIFVPHERSAAPPGRYAGTVAVTWKGGAEEIQIDLEVWDFALPQENHLRGDIWNGSMREMPPREELLYYQLAHQHRFLPLIYAYRPKLRVQGTSVQIDWTEYDKRLSRYLDGSAFTEKDGYWGPGLGLPVDHIMLPFDIKKKTGTAWPVDLPKEGRTPEYEAVWKEAGRMIRAHMDADPKWRKVMKVAFLNGLDESYNEEAYEMMIYYGRLLHEAMGRGWFKYRIDGGYSPEAMEKLSKEVELLVCHTVEFDAEVLAGYAQKGVESWFYGPMIYEQRKNSGCGSNTFLDLDLLVNRAIGWIGWKYHSGWVQWEFDWNAFAAWYEAENFKEPERIFNGSGQLIYRGAVMGYDRPIPSIRLKAQRRGLQDYEYFWLLAKKTGTEDPADRLVNRIVYKQPFGEKAMLDTEIWKNNPDEWEKARMEAGAAIASASPASAQAPAVSSAKQELPRVVLVGDSIRLGYAPVVAQLLAGKAIVLSQEANGGDSANLARNLENWVIRENPDVVHLNAGLHDLKLSKQTGKHQVEIESYRANLRLIIGRIRQETHASLIFANTTPILDQRHARRGADFDRLESDVERYNAVATAVMLEQGVTVDDLHGVIAEGGVEGLLEADGTHYTPEGYQRLGTAVADSVLRQLVISRYRPLSTPASGLSAAASYRKEEAERDAKVPPRYRNMKFGEFHAPESAAAWEKERPDIRNIVLNALGDLPPRPAPARGKVMSREIRRGYTLEKVSIDNGCDGEVTALLLIPVKRAGPAPAILWLHSSTPDKTQIIIPNTNGGEEALGEALVRAGYVVFSPDAYWHGDRAGTGPAGPAETSREEQESLFKLDLWLGRTLWGMFVRDDQIALDYLAGRPEVDPLRIGTTGMSMGSTRAWWLAAVDERVAAVAGVACLTRYSNLIAHGQLRQHGIYYFADGLLKHFDSEGVLALIAPRPFLALTGDLDAGSPADGIRALEEKVGLVYAALGTPDHFKSVLYPGLGHVYTPEMRSEMLAWFARWLKPAPRE